MYRFNRIISQTTINQFRLLKLAKYNSILANYSTTPTSTASRDLFGYDFAKKYLKSFPQNVIFPKTFDNYYSNVYPSRDGEIKETATISFFYTPQSTKALSVLDQVVDLAKKYPNNKFLIINADVVPRAAYDADIQHFPVALISFGGDCNRALVHLDDYYQWNEKYEWIDVESLDSCNLAANFAKKLENEIKSFSCSYNSKAGTHSYTHGIDTDNLNVKRVGWPSE